MNSYREVRGYNNLSQYIISFLGDGNCFYRAAGFSYLEHLFL